MKIRIFDKFYGTPLWRPFLLINIFCFGIIYSDGQKGAGFYMTEIRSLKNISIDRRALSYFAVKINTKILEQTFFA